MYPADYEEVTAGATVVRLDAAKSAIADAIRLDLRGGPIRYVLHRGTPTPTFGIPSPGEGEILTLNRAEAIGFRAIAEGAEPCILRATYYSRP